MDPLEQLKTDRLIAIRQLEKINKKAEDEKRDFTAEEDADIDRYTKEIAEFDKQIEEAGKRAQKKVSLRENLIRMNAALGATTAIDAEGGQRRSIAMATAVSGSSLEAERIEIPRSGVILRGFTQGATRAENLERAYRAGMHMNATMAGNPRAIQWCKEHGVEIRAASESVNASGGFLVGTELSDAIIDLREQYGVYRANARKEIMTFDTKMVPVRTDHLTGYWVGEGAAVTQSQMGFTNVELVAKKRGILTAMSTELEEDAVINMAEFIARDMAWNFALIEDQCGFGGDGTSTYCGMLGISGKLSKYGSTAKGFVRAAAAGTSMGTLVQADIANLIGAVAGWAIPRAKFYCSSTFKSAVFDRLAVSAGGNTVLTVGLPGSYQFLGYPIVITQAMTMTTGTLTTLTPLCIFGDLELGAMIGTRRDVTIKESREYLFGNDQVAILGTERFMTNCFSIGDNTTAVGSLACLFSY